VKSSVNIWLGILAMLLWANAGWSQFDGVHVEGLFTDSVNRTVIFKNTVYSNGDPIYFQEEQSITIDNSGKWWMNVGEGTVLPGSSLGALSLVDFNSDSLGMSIEVDFGTGYNLVTSSYFRFVPYAFHSKFTDADLAVLHPLTDVDTSGLNINNVFSWNGLNWILTDKSALTANYSSISDSTIMADTVTYAEVAIINVQDTVAYSFANDSSNFSMISANSSYADSSNFSDTTGYAYNSNGLNLNGDNVGTLDYFGSSSNHPVEIRTNGTNVLTLGVQGEFELGTSDSLSSFFIDGIDGISSSGIKGAGSHLSMSNGEHLYYSPFKVSTFIGTSRDTLWDDVNSGEYGFAHGRSSWVRTNYSAAFGDSSFVTDIPGFVLSTGPYSLAVGKNCGASGGYSFSAGYQSWAKTNRSVAIGYKCLAPNGYANIAMGYGAVADGDIEPSIAIGKNILGDGKNCIGLGSNIDMKGKFGSFLYADNSTTDSLPGIPSPGWWTNKFMVRAAGGTIFYSDSNSTMGVQLFPGAGAWATISDSTKKENIHPVLYSTLLNRISLIDISSWNYIAQSSNIVHIGPMAQDFKVVFNLGEHSDRITTTDIDGVIIAGIKELNTRFIQLEENLSSPPACSAESFDQIESRLDRIERQLLLNKK